MGSPEVDFEYYIYGELGNEEAMVNSLRRERVQISSSSLCGLSATIPEAAVLSLPYLFESVAEADYFYDCCAGDIIRPYLEPLGRAVYHFGPVGSGNVAKIAKNLINANERVALLEVAALAEAGGLQLEQFFDMAAAVGHGSTVSRWSGAFSVDGNHAVQRTASNLLNKDIGLAADLARAYGLKTPMTQAAADTAKVWVAGWEKED